MTLSRLQGDADGALPYTREVFTATRRWTQARNLFTEQSGSPVGYDQAALA